MLHLITSAILGNPTSPASCTINFSGSGTNAGVSVSLGNKLGLINGFKFDGNSSVWWGLWATQDSVITCQNMILQHFPYHGIYSNNGSIIYATSVTCSYNGYQGFLANMQGIIYAQSCTASNNAQYGFVAWRNSSIYATSIVCSGNSLGGIDAQYKSFIDVNGTLQSTHIDSNSYIHTF